ncbi:unnamed protein product [Urochloa humidicola]
MFYHDNNTANLSAGTVDVLTRWSVINIGAVLMNHASSNPSLAPLLYIGISSDPGKQAEAQAQCQEQQGAKVLD